MFLFKFEPNDIYMAYLPLAHELELLSECTMMVFGVAVGYSSPNTMTDMSTKVAKWPRATRVTPVSSSPP